MATVRQDGISSKKVDHSRERHRPQNSPKIRGDSRSSGHTAPCACASPRLGSVARRWPLRWGTRSGVRPNPGRLLLVEVKGRRRLRADGWVCAPVPQCEPGSGPPPGLCWRPIHAAHRTPKWFRPGALTRRRERVRLVCGLDQWRWSDRRHNGGCTARPAMTFASHRPQSASAHC